MEKQVAYRGWELLRYFKAINANYIVSDKNNLDSETKLYFSGNNKFGDFAFGRFDPSNMVSIKLGENIPDELLSEGLYVANLCVGQGGSLDLLSLFKDIGIVEFEYYDTLELWSPDGDTVTFGKEKIYKNTIIILPSDMANNYNRDFIKSGLVYSKGYGLVNHIKEQIVKAIEKGFYDPRTGREYKFKNPHNYIFNRYNYGKLIS